MMVREQRAVSTIQVKRLDLTHHFEEATAQLRSQGTIKPDETVDSGYHWGVVPTDVGHFILCDEGVGSTKPLEEDGYRIDLYTQAPNGFGILPIARMVLDVEEMKKALTEEVVPLHEFIRVFGGRLEANYREWSRFFARPGRE